MDDERHTTSKRATPRWYSIDQAADYLGLTRSAVERQIERGVLQAEREGDGWRVALPIPEAPPANGGGEKLLARRTLMAPANGHLSDPGALAGLLARHAELTRDIRELEREIGRLEERARRQTEEIAVLRGEIDTLRAANRALQARLRARATATPPEARPSPLGPGDGQRAAPAPRDRRPAARPAPKPPRRSLGWLLGR